ncbi:MAG: carboxymuconolactone decarboxylase family protein [Chloroflexota bacterium]|nr:carboxymuconolactone decarboxylase family protein [Chloroflexota bacterium]
MESREELAKKSREFRQWYYGRDPKLSPVAEPVAEAFQLINETLFGHIYQRPALDVKTRSLCTIAALTVLNREKQLPGHITGALNCGATKQQIVELITQMLFYGGYPCTVNSLQAAYETFQVYDKEHGKG